MPKEFFADLLAGVYLLLKSGIRGYTLPYAIVQQLFYAVVSFNTAGVQYSLDKSVPIAMLITSSFSF